MSKKSRLQNRARPSTPKVSVALATDDGPNRKVRKEEARREREALQRKIARRGYLRWGAAGLVVVAIAAVALIVVLNKAPAEPPTAVGASPLPGALVPPPASPAPAGKSTPLPAPKKVESRSSVQSGFLPSPGVLSPGLTTP